MLSYFSAAVMLAQHDGVTLKQIDDTSEQLVHEATGVFVDFDVDGAARDLVHLGLLRVREDKWYPLPLSEANHQLNQTWDQWFNA
ncbi:MAG: hypothetical protein IT423_04155 [Pirellulaceae bacterium]|nr:hypothetical protein [Pirellulaceae bacterium]